MQEESTAIPAPSSVGPRWRRRLIRLAVFALLAYLLVCLIVWSLQTKLIFPGSFSQGKSFAVVHPSSFYELIELKTRDGNRTFAAFGAAIDELRRPLPDSAARPTLIYFYGNGEHLAHALGTMSWLRGCGANVLAVEYVGYGMADGSPSEQAVYATADAAYEYLMTRGDIDRTKIVPFGWSLGAAAAFDLASRRPVAGVVACSAFTDMPTMARHVFPWLPTSLLLRSRFDNLAKLARIDKPILLAHGRDDDLVPYRMSEALRSAAGNARLVPIEHAGHNDLLTAGREKLSAELTEFLGAISAPSTRPSDPPR